MDCLINSIVLYCIQNQIITVENEAWFRYGLGKRLSTLFVFIPCTLLAIHLSDIFAVVSYFASFFFLRSRANGYHASTALGCLCGSLVFEYLFLGVIYPHLNERLMGLLMSVSCIVVFVMAPYKHLNMHFTQDELIACRKSVRVRISLLALLSAFFFRLGIEEIAKGISLACAMASLLLCFAYISEWRTSRWKESK